MIEISACAADFAQPVAAENASRTNRKVVLEIIEER
jgi:hypothetical protein